MAADVERSGRRSHGGGLAPANRVTPRVQDLKLRRPVRPDDELLVSGSPAFRRSFLAERLDSSNLAGELDLAEDPPGRRLALKVEQAGAFAQSERSAAIGRSGSRRPERWAYSMLNRLTPSAKRL